MLKRLAGEFLGTFSLVFCGTGAIIINQESGGSVTHLGIALTFGLIVMVMILSFGHISGAHMNPAVTIALTMARRFKWGNIAPYIFAQLGGACSASLLLGPISGASMNPARSFSPALIANQFQSLWIYILGPILGSITAVAMHSFLQDDFDEISRL